MGEEGPVYAYGRKFSPHAVSSDSLCNIALAQVAVVDARRCDHLVARLQCSGQS